MSLLEKSAKIRYAAAVLMTCGAATTLFVSFKSTNLMFQLANHATYYIIFALFLTWLYSGLSSIFSSKGLGINNLISGWSFSFLAAVFFTAVIFISIKSELRVMNDEANLLSQAHSMFYEKRIDYVFSGKRYEFALHPLTRFFPIQPSLFPFLIQILHTLLGYHVSNVYILNGTALFTLLMITARCFEKKFGKIIALISVLFLLSQPVITLTATSGAFDLVNFIFLGISALALKHYLNSPSKQSFFWLWINLLMLACVRQESPVYFAICCAVLAVTGLLSRKDISFSFIIPATSIFLLPIIWQRYLIMRFLPWANEAPANEASAFSLKFFIRNLTDFIVSLTRFDFYLPFSNILNIVGLIGFVYFAFKFLKNKTQNKQSAVFSVVLFLWLTFQFTLVTSKHNYAVKDFLATRYYLPLAVTLSLFAARFLSEFKNRLDPRALLVFAIGIFLLYHPVSLQNKINMDRPGNARDHRIVKEFLDKQPRKNILLITVSPKRYIIHNYGAISFIYANSHRREILQELSRGYYDHIYVVQRRYSDGNLRKDQKLSKDYNLKLIHATPKLIISEVV